MPLTLAHHVTLHTVFARGLEQASGALHELIHPALTFQVLELHSLTQPTGVASLSRLIDTQVSAVQLRWKTATSGLCTLAFPARSATQFIAVCTGQAPSGPPLDALHTAVFSEVGTLILSNLLQTIQQLVRQPMTCTLPFYMYGTLAHVSAPKPGVDAAVAVLVQLGCTVAQQYLEGYVILLCNTAFYEALLTAEQTDCPEPGDEL